MTRSVSPLDGKLMCILTSMHWGTKGAVRAYGRVPTSDLNVTTCAYVKQRNVLAPVLLNLFLTWLLLQLYRQTMSSGVRMLFDLVGSLVSNWKKFRREVSIRYLEYTDDVALVSDSMDALEEILKALDALCSGMWLTRGGYRTFEGKCSDLAMPLSY